MRESCLATFLWMPMQEQPATASTLYPGRLTSIDALRGIAALGVVLYHAVLQTANATPNNFLQWPVKGIQLLSSYGYVGVFLFFVISGFCIHLQWAKAEASGKRKQINFLAFWKRRVRRLYPPYLLALAAFLLMAAYSVGIDVTHFFVYDLVLHLLMLHNLDPATCYSINGVFWTLAVEEQLYLAYFALLFLRRRWGWTVTLVVCALARVGWFFLSHLLWLATGFGIPVPEAALSHWFTWALGALAVEAWFGLVVLPRWCRSIWLGTAAVISGCLISYSLPFLTKDTIAHDGLWMLLHPMWGFGFFVLVNRAVLAERNWMAKPQRLRLKQAKVSGMSPLVRVAAFIGVFSYSLYLTHELVIMQSWRFVTSLPPILNTLFVIVPATVIFAWIFFNWCEKPFMHKTATQPREEAKEIFASAVAATEEAG